MRKFNTRFDPPPSPTIVAGGGLTQQHFRDECDLNVILKRYRASDLPQPMHPGVYADLTELPTSLADAFDRVAVAQEWFDSLPSDVRLSFDNDPRSALRLLMSNPEAARAAGLLGPDDPVKTNHSQAVETAEPEPATPKATEKPAVATVDDGASA